MQYPQPAHPMNLALFDFDGTLTTSDTWTPFIHFAVPRARLAAGGLMLSPVAIGYRLGFVPAATGRRLAARIGFLGADARVVRERGAEYAKRVLPGTLRPAAIDRLEWHRAHGDRVVVVSASLDVYLGPWCEARRLDYVCTKLEERDGRLTGRYVEGDCCGAEKARRVRQRYDLTRYPLVYAYGDTAEDRDMLELAHKKYYRWREISSWDEVSTLGHSRASPTVL